LLKASELELVPAGKHFGLDLIQPPHDIEHCDHRAAAILPEKAELTAVDPIDAVRVGANPVTLPLLLMPRPSLVVPPNVPRVIIVFPLYKKAWLGPPSYWAKPPVTSPLALTPLLKLKVPLRSVPRSVIV
jgi:hypothetical protein